MIIFKPKMGSFPTLTRQRRLSFGATDIVCVGTQGNGVGWQVRMVYGSWAKLFGVRIFYVAGDFILKPVVKPLYSY